MAFGVVINHIHRDDAARAIYHAATGACTPGIWNVSDSNPLTQLEYYRALAEKFGRPVPESVPRDLDRKRGWTNKRVSGEKLRATGWRPRHPALPDAAEEIAGTL